MICFSCGGPAHPATGHVHQRKPTIVIVCLRCYLDFLEWFRGRLRNPLTVAALTMNADPPRNRRKKDKRCIS